MNNYLPFVSIIICSKNRHKLLLSSVVSVLNAEYPADKRELIVVEESDKPESIDGVRYIYLPPLNKGLGYCHNTGIKHSSGEIIIYTDDDVIVDVSWIKEMVSVFAAPQIFGAAGLTRAQKIGAFGEAQELLGLPGGGLLALFKSKGQLMPTATISTCNAAYRREVFNEFTFLEDSFGRFGGDDGYMGKLVSDKFQCVFNPKAIVYHLPRNSISRLIHTYYRRQINDYLGRRDLLKQSKFRAIFGKLHQCVIFRSLAAVVLVAIFGFSALLLLLFSYYLLSLLSIRQLYTLTDNKASFYIYPFVKSITEFGILKGEILILCAPEKTFDKILNNY